jgi:hypothetical protein
MFFSAVENARGGGKGLEARDSYSFSSRNGHEVVDLFDERDDESWVEVEEGIGYEDDDCVSHLGFDENTFASSFATNLHVRGNGSSVAGSIRSKRTTFHPSTKGPCLRQDPVQRIQQRGGRVQAINRGAVTAKGGSCASYCTVHWLGTDVHGHSMRRVSHHVVFISGDIKKMLKAVRVSGDHKQFVIQMYRPKCLWDANSQCDWLAEEISSEFYPLPESQMTTLFKVHQRRVAMEQHTSKHFTPGEVPVDELRLDCAGIKVDPNFVTKSEDLVCYGASIWKEDDGTIRGNFELKELGKGSTEHNQQIGYGINLQDHAKHSRGRVPSSISVGSGRRSSHHSHTGNSHAGGTQSMEVDSSFHTYREGSYHDDEEYFSPQNNGKKLDGHCQRFYDGFTGEEAAECGSEMMEYAWERALSNAERLYLNEGNQQSGKDGAGKQPSIQVETVTSKDSEAYDGAPVASSPKKKAATASVASTAASSPRRSKRKAKQQEKASVEGPKEDDSSL